MKASELIGATGEYVPPNQRRLLAEVIGSDLADQVIAELIRLADELLSVIGDREITPHTVDLLLQTTAAVINDHYDLRMG